MKVGNLTEIKKIPELVSAGDAPPITSFQSLEGTEVGLEFLIPTGAESSQGLTVISNPEPLTGLVYFLWVSFWLCLFLGWAYMIIWDSIHGD